VRIYLTLIVMLFLLLIAFIFGSQNDQDIMLNYLVARTQMSVATAVSLFTVIGIFIGLSLALLWRFSRAIKRNASSANKKG